MRPGPTIIRACSGCGGYLEQPTIGSGNTFFARYWSDGKFIAPMLPDRPWLVRCDRCAKLLWIDEQKRVGQFPPTGPGLFARWRFPDTRTCSEPTFAEYAAFLESGVSDRRKERYVRIRAWWAGNDRRRVAGASMPLDDFEVRNLRALLPLFDETDANDRLLKAEAFRELGEFAAAEDTLAAEFPPDVARSASIIRALVRQRSTTVARME